MNKCLRFTIFEFFYLLTWRSIAYNIYVCKGDAKPYDIAYIKSWNNMMFVFLFVPFMSNITWFTISGIDNYWKNVNFIVGLLMEENYKKI